VREAIQVNDGTSDRAAPRLPSPLAGNPLRAIFEVSSALVASVDYHETLAALCAKIGEALDVSSVDIQTYEPELDVCVYDAYWALAGLTDDDLAYLGTVTRVSERPDIRAILSSAELTEQHTDDPHLSANDREHLQKWGYKSTLDMPLRIGDQVIGILGVQDVRFVRRFMPAERDQFHRLGELAALGIHNARMHRLQQERSRHLESLIEASRALASGRDPQDVYDAIALAAATAFGAPRSVVYEFDAAADTVTPRAIYQREYDPTYDTVGVTEKTDDALGDRSLMWSPVPVLEHVSDPALCEGSRTALQEWGEATCLNVPMVVRGQPQGMFMVSWTDRERLVTADELALAAGMGQQAGVALRNARLFGARPAEGAQQ
jgi:GAF domain-containing protein